MKFVLILLAMIYCHIFDDFTLQGIMKNMKQKSWWKEQTTNETYKYDYVIVLALHAFSWTFTTLLPIMLYMILTNSYLNTMQFISIFIINWIIHLIVDNEKANKFSINLIHDQLIHLGQIIITWLIFILSV